MENGMDNLFTKNVADCEDLYGVSDMANDFPYIREITTSVAKRHIYYISDLHVEFKNKKGFLDSTYAQYINHVVAGMNSGTPFGDDPLLIAGDISCYLSHVDYFFSQLRMRREGLIIFVLGNHEIWNYEETTNRNLSHIIEEYRKICLKHDVILLHNELAFFYDERTGKGELLPYYKTVTVSTNELLSIEPDKLQKYSNHAKLIFFGGIGFSGTCKVADKKGHFHNADAGFYKDIVPTLEEDIMESKKCETAYRKVLTALKDTQVIILTHSPFNYWSTLEHNPNYIYVSGHTHHQYFEQNKKRTIFADNQIGYSSDCYDLKYFYVDGTYDIFKHYPDGIYEISYQQYIDFNIGKNIRLKKKNDGKQIYLLKRSEFYMFVYYNAKHKLVLLNGGSSKILTHDIDYYYENLALYGVQLNAIMGKYTSALYNVSNNIQKIGGSGTIHGCIVDIDYYNHIYINPIDGRVIPYYAINMEQKYVYKDLERLLEAKCPSLLPTYKKWKSEEPDSFMLIPSNFEMDNGATLVTDKNMYMASRAIRTIQYLLFQNVVRDWNDKIIQRLKNHSEDVFEEINKVTIDEKIFSK